MKEDDTIKSMISDMLDEANSPYCDLYFKVK